MPPASPGSASTPSALVLVADYRQRPPGAQRMARDEALRASRFDALTGLFNRAFFVTAMEQEIRRSERMDRGFALLMLDLDDLKPVNDTFGHQWGDRLHPLGGRRAPPDDPLHRCRGPLRRGRVRRAAAGDRRRRGLRRGRDAAPRHRRAHAPRPRSATSARRSRSASSPTRRTAPRSSSSWRLRTSPCTSRSGAARTRSWATTRAPSAWRPRSISPPPDPCRPASSCPRRRRHRTVGPAGARALRGRETPAAPIRPPPTSDRAGRRGRHARRRPRAALRRRSRRPMARTRPGSRARRHPARRFHRRGHQRRCTDPDGAGADPQTSDDVQAHPRPASERRSGGREPSRSEEIVRARDRDAQRPWIALPIDQPGASEPPDA